MVVLGQSSHEVALRAALEPPHGHRKYIYFDSPLSDEVEANRHTAVRSGKIKKFLKHESTSRAIELLEGRR